MEFHPCKPVCPKYQLQDWDLGYSDILGFRHIGDKVNPKTGKCDFKIATITKWILEYIYCLKLLLHLRNMNFFPNILYLFQ